MSKRKIITPAAVPQQAEVIHLDNWRREDSHTEKDYAKVLIPLNSLPRDNFSAVQTSRHDREIGFKRGDYLIVYHTEEVTRGDYVALKTED